MENILNCVRGYFFAATLLLGWFFTLDAQGATAFITVEQRVRPTIVFARKQAEREKDAYATAAGSSLIRSTATTVLQIDTRSDKITSQTSLQVKNGSTEDVGFNWQALTSKNGDSGQIQSPVFIEVIFP